MHWTTDAGCVTVKLSTGHPVTLAVQDQPSRRWRARLAQALVQDRLLAEAEQPQDRMAPGLHWDVVANELRYLLTTADPAVKDLLLATILFEDVRRLVRALAP